MGLGIREAGKASVTVAGVQRGRAGGSGMRLKRKVGNKSWAVALTYREAEGDTI